MNKLFFIFLFFISSCDLGVLSNFETKAIPNGIFICNEGNFMSGNASLSIYNPDTKEVQNQIIASVNNVELGDVCQSMTIIDGKGFVVVNNSAKVIVIDINTYEHIGKITGLNSPRYIEKISPNKIYITDLYSKQITIVNPRTLKITGYIQIGKGTEQMVRYGDYIFTCSWSRNNKVYKIDTRTDKLVDSIVVTKQPNSIVIDKNNKIWVLSDGSYPKSPYTPEIPALTKIDAATFTIETEFKFPTIEQSPSELAINGSLDTLYYINGGYHIQNVPKKSLEVSGNGIFTMSIDDKELPVTAIIPEDGRLFYGLGVHPVSSDIYVTDAIDYQQKGFVLRYNSKGEQLDKFKTDIIPSAFCFR